MGHYDLTDAEWRTISPLFPSRTTARGGRPYNDHRRTLDAILFVLVTGSPWRGLPEGYGPWKSAYSRFSRYCATGFLAEVCGALRDGLRARGAVDADLWCLDATVVRAHKAAAGARRAVTGRGEKRGPSRMRAPGSHQTTPSAARGVG